MACNDDAHSDVSIIRKKNAKIITDIGYNQNTVKHRHATSSDRGCHATGIVRSYEMLIRFGALLLSEATVDRNNVFSLAAPKREAAIKIDESTDRLLASAELRQFFFLGDVTDHL